MFLTRPEKIVFNPTEQNVLELSFTSFHVYMLCCVHVMFPLSGVDFFCNECHLLSTLFIYSHPCLKRPHENQKMWPLWTGILI